MDSEEKLLCKDMSDRLATLQLHRSLLEKDVQRLKTKLSHEIDLRKALEFGPGFGDELCKLNGYKHNLPAEVRELLSEVASVESVVSNLEEKVVLLRQEIGTAKAHRTRIIVASSNDDTSIENLRSRVEEIKLKVHDIETVSTEFQSRQTAVRNHSLPEQTFFGLPLGSRKKPVPQRRKKPASAKRTSLDDTNIVKNPPQKARSHSLFTGKLYSSVDVPNAAALLGRFKSKKKPLQ